MNNIVQKSVEENLKDVLGIMKKAYSYLEDSFTKVNLISTKLEYSVSEVEMVEVFTSRFARLVDLLLKKAYRSLDAYELLESGSLIDIIHRSEKRGIVDSLVQIRILKDIRNMIAHEYAGENFQIILLKTKELTPYLISLAKKYENYCQQLLLKEEK